jgi:hypothetical protein
VVVLAVVYMVAQQDQHQDKVFLVDLPIVCLATQVVGVVVQVELVN